MVFFHHVCFTSITLSSSTSLVRFFYTLSIHGKSGVDIFFVLSGFLITSILIGTKDSRRYYKDFYWKRVLRIFPLYLVCLILLSILLPEFRKYCLLAALFIANFASVLHVPSFGPFWTLAIEEQFYIVWPTVVRRRPVKQVQIAAVGLVIACILLRFIFAMAGHYNYYLTPLRCDGLAAGAMLACWWATRSESHRSTTQENKFIIAAVVVGVSLLVLGYMEGHHSPAFGEAFTQTGVTLIATSLVAHMVSNRNAPWLSWARSRILTFFGLISYAFYMIHLYVLSYWDNHSQLITSRNGPYLWRFAAVLGITVALSLVSRYVIELPAQRLRKYVLPRG